MFLERDLIDIAKFDQFTDRSASAVSCAACSVLWAAIKRSVSHQANIRSIPTLCFAEPPSPLARS